MSDFFPSPKAIKMAPAEETTKLNMGNEILSEVMADMSDSNELGNPIHEGLAKRVVTQFHENSQKSDIRNQLFKTYKIPENCKEIQVPKMNRAILDMKTFHDVHKKNEKKLYSAQQFITRAVAAVSNVADVALKAENEMVDHKVLVRSCLDATTLLGYASHEINTRRKSNVKYALHHDVRDICNSSEVVKTEFLFGDDFTNSVKAALQASRIANKAKTVTKHGHSPSSSHGRKSSRQQPKQGHSKHFLGKGKTPSQGHRSYNNRN